MNESHLPPRLTPPPSYPDYPMMDPELAAFHRMRLIMDQLRDHCPWDRKQDFDSLRTLTIEEVYELAEAIAQRDWPQVAGEMGDLFLHLLFYARLGRESGTLRLGELLENMCQKLIRRHPHLYASIQASTPEEVKSNWEKIKLGEGRKSVLEGVPTSMPAMVKAMRIQEKVAGVGFDWKNATEILDKVHEELKELSSANTPEQVHEEWGDLMFTMINWARFRNINAENALESANQKFIRRFRHIESVAAGHGTDITQMNMDLMQAAWEEAKKTEKS